MARAAEAGSQLSAVPTPYLTAADFPPAGAGRHWVVKHNPKSRTAPVTVELRESTIDHDRGYKEGFTRLLALDYTIADKAAIASAAEAILVRVGRIDDVVGVY